MGWMITLGVLTLIAIVPIGVSAFYDEEGPRAFVIIGPFRSQVFPSNKEKEKKKGREKKTKEKIESNASEQKKKKKKKGGSIHDFLPVVDVVLDFLAAFGRKIRVNHLEMKLVLGGSNPSDLAVNYGRGWAVLGNLVPLLERAFIIKKRDLEVECDFLAENTVIIARLDLTITVVRVLSLLTIRGIPIIRELINLKKLFKGGAKA